MESKLFANLARWGIQGANDLVRWGQEVACGNQEELLILLWTLISVFLVYIIIPLVIFLATLHIVQVRQNKLYPAGPTGKPFLGMLWQIKQDFHLFLFDQFKTHGSIFSFRMFTKRMVILADAKLIRKAFSMPEFSARPKNEFSNILGGYGIINTDGELWKSQRKFLHQQKFGMKHWGAAGEQMEARITQQVLYLLTSIESEKTNPFNPAPILNCAISNVICSIIMSIKFNHKDPKFQRFMHLFDEGFRLFSNASDLVFMPFLKHLPGQKTAVKALTDNRNEMLQFVSAIISEHKEKLDVENPTDLVDSYLMEIEKATAEGTLDQVFSSKDPELQLSQILLDLFTAGTETIKTTMQWAILHMMHNPDVRRKVQAELDTVVGPHRLPCSADMPDLPYTRATIYEVMRRATVVPMATTHTTTRAVNLEGHLIPKGSYVIPLLYAVHMDPEVWDQPEEFRPDRFLSEDGTKVQKPQHFMPFSTGQRMCLGDKLAEMELQLFFSSLMHIYDIEAPNPAALPSVEGRGGSTLTPHDFDVNFVPRNVEALISANSKGGLKDMLPYFNHVRTHGRA